ncbi:phage tail tape measure protein [Enterococcus dongliensis]|uniref:Phage tail tape measure protein n=2 Tax=Enterococcus dongliensis TaxID=2559925 RepID=A0AAW8TKM2_9ENTE|nr:phage tail tape measure protein [Enterococcus dongliensis]MDT2635709.1 phage tail tape measure protein [Enterococcus dongliensis]MDT2637635.1 phage tail tape measure protein [Enterococcus dongliensis]MDT2642745.1 phage tail tape measure protein [Enterococcus dongliensis]
MTKLLTVPILGAGIAAAKIGGDFEEQMSRVKAISGATGSSFDQLKQQAIDLGAKTAFSAKESAAGMENLASAGFDANEIMEAMPGLLDLAAVSGGDVALASENAAAALRGFGLDAGQAGHVADVFARAAADTNAEVADMGDAMKYIAPVANAMGISLEESAAAIGIMSDAGIKGSQAGTSLRGALSRIAKPTKPMIGVMDELGLSFYDAEGNMKSLKDQVGMLQQAFKGLTPEQQQNALVTLYGQESLSGMMALIDKGPDSLGKLTNSLKDSNGAADEMARTMQDNMNSSIEQMMGAFESAAIVIQGIIAPAIRGIADTIGGLVQRFIDAPEPIQKMVLVIAGLVAAIGPLLFIGGSMLVWFAKLKVAVGFLSTSFPALGGVFTALTGPVGIVIGIIALLVGAFVIAWNTSEGFQNAVTSIWESIKNTISFAVQTVSNTITRIFGSVVQWWKDNNEEIAAAVNAIWNGKIGQFIRNAMGVIQGVIVGVWTAIKGITEGIWTAISGVIEGALRVIQGLIKFVLGVLSGDWSMAWEGMVEAASGILYGLGGLVVGALEAVIGVVKGFFSIFKNAGWNLVKMIADGIWSAISLPVKAISAVVSKVRRYLPFSPAKEGPLSDLDQLNFGGTISTGIYSGQSEINRAMASVMDIPTLSNLNASLGVKHSVITRNENRTNKQPATFNIRLGNQQFKAFVDDISQAQGQETEINLGF